MKHSKEGSGLRLLLHSCGMKPAELAERIGESRQSVTNWMARGLPAHQIFAVAAALDMQPEDLRPYMTQKRVSDAEMLDMEVDAFLARLPNLSKERRLYVMRRLMSSFEDE